MISFASIVRLGWGYARVLARKLRPERNQLQRFVAQYEADGIVPFEPRDMRVLDGASKCTACGHCDVVALRSATFHVLGPRGPMAFVLGVSRHSGEHDAAEFASPADPDALDALRAACPVRVPFGDLADLVARRAAVLRKVRSGHDAERDRDRERDQSPTLAPSHPTPAPNGISAR